MSKLEQLLKDVEDADAAEGHVLEEWKDDPLHLDADAAWEASMVASIKAKKALLSYQTTKKQKYKKLRSLLNKASEMLDNLYTAHLEDRRKKGASK